jgi:GT2 family glycosyltransferase
VELLKKLLDSIKKQIVAPHQIIIVDGSDQPINSQIQEYLSDTITCVRCFPPSLTKQRNAGLNYLQGDITLIGYLDDDIEFEPDTIQNLLRFWESCPDNTGGTQFNIINNPPRNLLSRGLTRFFFIDSKISGKVLRSGFVSTELPLIKDLHSEWLCGGATIWKREVLRSYSFDEWYAGWAYHEDVDFSYRVSRKYDLVVLAGSKVWHNPPPYNNSKKYALGKMMVVNRYHFIEKYPEFSTFPFYWSTCGQIILNVLKSLWDRDRGGINEAQGNISGLHHILRKDYVQLDENFREHPIKDS